MWSLVSLSVLTCAIAVVCLRLREGEVLMGETDSSGHVSRWC
jgi:hypothetical protein